jgi:hypothetical protein
MNKLEQKIFDELDQFEKFSTYITKQDAARISAKIALEIAEKAYNAGCTDGAVLGTNEWNEYKREVVLSYNE